MRDGEDEAALVEAWRRGDPEAARHVVVLHGPTLLRVALSLCTRPEDAEEVVQDALLLAHRSLAGFDSMRGSLRSWLVGVTANRARQVRRARARYGRFLALMSRDSYDLVSAPKTIHGDLAFARRRLATLPAREREAFVLVEIEELSSVEAARVMGISDSTVRVLVTRARSRLQRGAVAPLPLRAEGEGRR